MGGGMRPMAKPAESAIGRRRPPRDLDFFFNVRCSERNGGGRSGAGAGGSRTARVVVRGKGVSGLKSVAATTAGL